MKIDRVYIGSCTGGKTEDFLAAAKVFLASVRSKTPVCHFVFCFCFFLGLFLLHSCFLSMYYVNILKLTVTLSPKFRLWGLVNRFGFSIIHTDKQSV